MLIIKPSSLQFISYSTVFAAKFSVDQQVKIFWKNIYLKFLMRKT